MDNAEGAATWVVQEERVEEEVARVALAATLEEE